MSTNQTVRRATVEKSRDPSWVRWQVRESGQDTLWFYSELDAQDYAAAVRANDEDKIQTMRLRTVQ